MDGQVVMEWTRVNCWSEVPVLVLFSTFLNFLSIQIGLCL